MNFNAPLGLKPPPRPSAWRMLPLALGATLALAGVVGLGAYLYRADPHGGEPYAVALVPPAPPQKAPVPFANPPDPTPTGSIGGAEKPDAVRMENGVKVVSPADARRDAAPFVIDVSKALDEGARKTASREQPAPRNGLPSVTTGRDRPRVAIVVGALGLSAAATRTALDKMPPAVAFAFVANADGIKPPINEARSKGHELLLQLPMQSSKDMASGPHTLRVGETAGELTGDLDWLASRFDGYVGIANLLGAPVTANQSTMSTILRSVAKRGVFYLDDGTSKRSVAPALGSGLGVATVQADVVLDATGDPAVVQANLDRLVATARAKGSAIGMASGLTDHLPVIARYAASLDAKGVTLVPVSAIVRSNASLATAR